MIQVPPNANVVVMREPISFRYGIDGTAAIARAVLEKEPMDGAFFIFRNRRRHMLRVLFYEVVDGDDDVEEQQRSIKGGDM